MKLLLLISLLLSQAAFGQVTSISELAQPLQSYTNLVGIKVLSAYNTTNTTNGFEYFYDPSTGLPYQTTGKLSVEVLGYSMESDVGKADSSEPFQIVYSTGTITPGSATAPTGATYTCGAVNTLCMPGPMVAYTWEYYAMHFLINPLLNNVQYYLSFQHSNATALAKRIRLYIRGA